MKNLLNKDRHITRLLVIMAIVLAAMAVLNPSVFYSASNFSSMAVQFPELGFLSIAAALVLMSGGIDLSITGTAVFSGIVAARIMLASDSPDGPSVMVVVLACAAALLVGLACGAVNAVLVAKVGITPMLVTLGTMNLFTGIGIGMTPAMLRLMDTPAEVMADATAYLTIYFAGVTGLLVYNMGSGILRAIGDSQRPFYYLVVSAVTNTVLDLVFVLCFKMGVEGVAYATIIAQALSAALVLIELCRSQTCIRLRFRDLRINGEMLRKTVKVGFPAGLQMAVTSFSNVFVQSYINYFGPDCMSGWTAYSKLDQLIFLPMQSLALASTTFVGQNLGSRKAERAQQGVRIALWMSVLCTALLIVPVELFAPQLTAFFNSKPEVVRYGTLLLRYLSPFYVLCCVNQVYSGALRGSGNSRTPMIIMLLSFVAFRQCYLYAMANWISNEILPIAMGYPAGWLVCSAATLLYYNRKKFAKNEIMDDAPREAAAEA